VRNALELGRNLPRGSKIGAGQQRCAGGSQDIGHVVLPPQPQILAPAEHVLGATEPHTQRLPLQKGSLLNRPLHAEQRHVASSAFSQRPSVCIILIENGPIAGPLIVHDRRLGPDIVLHRRMAIEVVGSDIRHHGDVWAPGLERDSERCLAAPPSHLRTLGLGPEELQLEAG